MLSQADYARYSIPLEQQMRRVSLIGPRFRQATQSASTAGAPAGVVADATALSRELDGAPGDGALEVYRDLDQNIRSAEAFVAKWRAHTDLSAQRLVSLAEEMLQELRRLASLVSATPPEAMAAIKQTLTRTFGTDAQRFDFPGSNAAMLLVFVAVLALRYFDVILWSWWVVWPAALAAAVAVAAAISTVIHRRL